MAGYLKHPKAAHEAFYDSLPKLSFGRIFEQVWVLGSSANNKLCFIYFFGKSGRRFIRFLRLNYA
jgi:hypothetical protein